MQEIIRVARDKRLIIICSIHQPSSKVYNRFNQIMILSKGCEVFTGDAKDAAKYFESIGRPTPPATNPAEHFLDLVNSDFSSDKDVDRILHQWESTKGNINKSAHHAPIMADDEQSGVADGQKRANAKEVVIMFRRHMTLIVRDPVLYLGQCAIFLIANLVFEFVYWNARDFTQDQAQNKLWINLWFIAVPSQSE